MIELYRDRGDGLAYHGIITFGNGRGEASFVLNGVPSSSHCARNALIFVEAGVVMSKVCNAVGRGCHWLLASNLCGKAGLNGSRHAPVGVVRLQLHHAQSVRLLLLNLICLHHVYV